MELIVQYVLFNFTELLATPNIMSKYINCSFLQIQGGNDHEIYEDHRTIGHTVMDPQETIVQLQQLFLNNK